MNVEQCVFSLSVSCLPNIAQRFRTAGHQAIDRICEYYYSMEERHAVVPQVEPGYLARSVPRKTCSSFWEWETEE